MLIVVKRHDSNLLSPYRSLSRFRGTVFQHFYLLPTVSNLIFYKITTYYKIISSLKHNREICQIIWDQKRKCKLLDKKYFLKLFTNVLQDVPCQVSHQIDFSEPLSGQKFIRQTGQEGSLGL